MSIFDEVLEMEKEANHGPQGASQFGTFGRGLGDALATGAGAGMAGAAIAGVGVAASKIYDAMTKARDFRAMLGSSFNADLMPHYQQRPREFNEAFSSLRSMNPGFSKDPMVAGTYMRRIFSFGPEQAGGVLIESLSHRKDTPDSPIFEAFQRTGTQAAGSVMGKAMERPKSHESKLRSPEEMEQEKQLIEARRPPFDERAEYRKAEIREEVRGKSHKAKGGGGGEGGRKPFSSEPTPSSSFTPTPNR